MRSALQKPSFGQACGCTRASAALAASALSDSAFIRYAVTTCMRWASRTQCTETLTCMDLPVHYVADKQTFASTARLVR